MRGKYAGVMSVEDFFQALYQDFDFFQKHNISHIKGACLYFTPCDGHGSTLIVRGSTGDIIDGYISAGAYQCAAQLYESCQLEPQPVSRSTLTSRPKNAF